MENIWIIFEMILLNVTLSMDSAMSTHIVTRNFAGRKKYQLLLSATVLAVLVMTLQVFIAKFLLQYPWQKLVASGCGCDRSGMVGDQRAKDQQHVEDENVVSNLSSTLNIIFMPIGHTGY